MNNINSINKVNSFIKKWYGKEIENYFGETSPEYKQFQKEYKSLFKNIASDIEMNLYSFNPNHYEFSAVMQSNTTKSFYYISISDVRFWDNEWANNILYRTMEHDKDWHGGSNHYTNLQELANNLEKLNKNFEKDIEFDNDY